MVWGFIVGLVIGGWSLLCGGHVPDVLWDCLDLPEGAFIATLVPALFFVFLLPLAPNKLRGMRPALAAVLERLADGLRMTAAGLFAICLVMGLHALSTPVAHLQTVILSGWLSVCLALCSYSVGSLADGVIDFSPGTRA